MKFFRLFLFLSVMLTLFLVSCKRSLSDPANSGGDASVVHEEPSIVYQAGDHDDKGRIVVFAIGDRYEFLDSDAALVFRNIGTESEPKPLYDLTTRAHGHHAYSSLDEMAKAISNMPHPRIVDFYSTCGAPPWYGLPEKEVDAFYNEMKKLGVVLRDQGENGFMNIICTCPH